MPIFEIQRKEMQELISNIKSLEDNSWYLKQIENKTEMGELIRRYTETEFTTENYDFLSACKAFDDDCSQVDFPNEKILEYAKALNDQRIKQDAPEEVNIDYGRKKSVAEAIERFEKALSALKTDKSDAAQSELTAAKANLKKAIDSCRDEVRHLMTGDTIKRLRTVITNQIDNIITRNDNLFKLNIDLIKYAHEREPRPQESRSSVGFLQSYTLKRNEDKSTKALVARTISEVINEILEAHKTGDYEEFILSIREKLKTNPAALKLFNQSSSTVEGEGSTKLRSYLESIKTCLSPKQELTSQKGVQKRT